MQVFLVISRKVYTSIIFTTNPISKSLLFVTKVKNSNTLFILKLRPILQPRFIASDWWAPFTRYRWDVMQKAACLCKIFIYLLTYLLTLWRILRSNKHKKLHLPHKKTHCHAAHRTMKSTRLLRSYSCYLVQVEHNLKSIKHEKLHDVDLLVKALSLET